ncbi:MAG: ABC transporter ATP-binding protein [Myxococcaceae bacterium]|nr:ABC transporter ATP-binding protein [Myxococcaceae bacterium]
MTALARLDGVTASYGSAAVLRDVSWTVRGGEAWAVLGPNGAGKSSLVKVLAGLLKPTRGTAQVGPHDVAKSTPRLLAQQVAWVPQQVPDGLDFTALEVALMGRAPHVGALGLTTSADEARARRALERFDVAALADRPLSELSGGERRRVFLARGLVQDAPLLVLDEPTAFLDVRHQVETLTLARGLVSDTHAVVAVLHDVTLAAHFATHVVLLSAGRVVAAGRAAEVLTAEQLSSVYGTPMEAVGPGGFLPRWPT